MKKIIFLLLIGGMYSSCRNGIYLNRDIYGNYYPTKKINKQDYNEEDVDISYLGKRYVKEFIYFELLLDRCPGQFSDSCIRGVNLYDESKPKRSFLNYQNYSSTYFLNDKQGYILDFDDYKFFLERVDKNLFNNNFSNIKNIFNKSKIINDSKTLKTYALDDVNVYVFNIDCDVFNYYFPNKGKIYPYSEDGNINIYVIQ